MNFPTNNDLDFWVKHKRNALFIGEKGVGKSEIIFATFNRNYGKINEDWLYFSCPTLDPFVDFIGIPTKGTNEKDESFIELLRPAFFKKASKIKGIFIDEINRPSSVKVLNGIMELIQFKTINGFPFPNLEIIWAAANPSDEEQTYHVEKLDPAQEDRFQIIYEMPYDVSDNYFLNKFKKTLPENTIEGALEWWRQLPKEIQKKVSPRRLDYALEHHMVGGNLRHVLPSKSNIPKLLERLNSGSYENELKDLIKKGPQAVRARLANENFFHGIKNMVIEKPEFNNIIQYFSDERIAQTLNVNNIEAFEKAAQNVPSLQKVLIDISNAGVCAPELKDKLLKMLEKFNLVEDIQIGHGGAIKRISIPNTNQFMKKTTY